MSNSFERLSVAMVYFAHVFAFICSWPETPVPAADLDDGDTRHYYYQ